MLRVTFSTSRATTGHILWLFLAPFGPKWLYLAIGSLSSPKWVEYWVNMIEHCSPHPGGSVRTFFGPQKISIGAPETPKSGFFGSKMDVFCHRRSQQPQMGWTIGEHCISHPGGSIGTLYALRKMSIGASETPKKLLFGVQNGRIWQ